MQKRSFQLFEFIQYRKDVGVQLATLPALRISQDIGDGNIFSEIVKEPSPDSGIIVKIICNGMPFTMGTVTSEEHIPALQEKFMRQHFAQIRSELESLRIKSIELFRSNPCKETFDAMKFAHGTCRSESLQGTKLDVSKLLPSNGGGMSE